MARMRRVDVRLATQVLVLQVAVVTLTLGLAGGLLAFFSHERLAAQYETQSLDVARAIAFAPLVRADVARYDTTPLSPSPALTNELASGQLQQLASEIQQSAHLLFVVITNDQGVGCPIPTATNSANTSAPIRPRHWRATRWLTAKKAHSARRYVRKFLSTHRIRIA